MQDAKKVSPPSIALQKQHVECVCEILQRVLNPSASEPNVSPNLVAWVFGSRATGHARAYSDLDLLISEPRQLGWRERADLADAFEASALPFRVDVVEESRLAPSIAPRILAERLRLL